MFSTLIIDDEKDQQDILASLLQKNFSNYSILSFCKTVDEGIEKIQKLRPQLVFLDIILPPDTGFDLLTRLSNIDFEVIFVTSHEQFALPALKMSAVDFILKPFSLVDLKTALGKFEKRISEKSSLNHLEVLLQNIQNDNSKKSRIALPTLHGFVFANVSDVIRCKSDDMYTTFYFNDKSNLMVSRTMKECEELLAQLGFFRVHASHLINMSYIKEYIRGDGGQVKMIDGSIVDVSRRKKEEFMNALNKL